MKLKDLKEQLNSLPAELDECEVILQKDSEGNGYSPLCGVDENCVYLADSTYSGDVYSLEYTAEDNCMEEEDWEELKNDKNKRCVVLHPTN